MAPDGLVIVLQGDSSKLRLACGRRLDRGQDFNPILGVQILDELSAVPLFIRDHHKVSWEDGARESGQPAGDLRDGRARVGGQGDEGLFGRLVLGIEGADRFPIAVLLGDKGLFHRLTRVGLNVVGIDVNRMPWRDVAEGNQALAQGGLARQGTLDRDRLKKPVLGRGRREKGEACEEAEVGAADRIDSANAGGIAEYRFKDEP